MIFLAKNSQDTGMAILAYFIFFLPLILAPKSTFAKYHANQSLVLLIAWVVVMVVVAIVPVIGWILSPLAGLFVLILWIMGIINAAQGVMKPLPLIGSITILK